MLKKKRTQKKEKKKSIKKQGKGKRPVRTPTVVQGGEGTKESVERKKGNPTEKERPVMAGKT